MKASALRTALPAIIAKVAMLSIKWHVFWEDCIAAVVGSEVFFDVFFLNPSDVGSQAVKCCSIENSFDELIGHRRYLCEKLFLILPLISCIIRLALTCKRKMWLKHFFSGIQQKKIGLFIDWEYKILIICPNAIQLCSPDNGCHNKCCHHILLCEKISLH